MDKSKVWKSFRFVVEVVGWVFLVLVAGCATIALVS